MRMKNEVHEKKALSYRIIGCQETTQAPRHARAIGATWTCAVHCRMLTLSPVERAQLDVLRGLIQQGQHASVGSRARRNEARPAGG
jgi:hypothetical protein